MKKILLAILLCSAVGVFAATSYTTTIKTGDDSFIQSAKPSATPGQFTMLMAGRSSFATRGNTRTLIRFDLSSIANKFNTVTSAKIKLYLLSDDGIAITNDTLKVYKISAANRTWSAGTGATIGDSTLGGACHKWLAYDNTFYSPQDANCPACPRRSPWASEVALWNNGHGTLASITGGLPIAGTDYEANAIGTAIVNSSQKNSFVEITLTANSFFKDWANTTANNAGFVIDLARVDTSKRECATFASFDHTNADYYPQLEISFSDWTGSVVKTIDYSFPAAGRVSMLIRNSKQVIKEVMWAKAQTGGAQSYSWDARDLNGKLVPDGNYQAKILQTQGLTAEYMGVAGISVPLYEGWVCNHFPPLCLAVDDTSGVYIAGGGEITPALLKMKPNGTRLWTGNVDGNVMPIGHFFVAVNAMASDGGKLYFMTSSLYIRTITGTTAAPVNYASVASGLVANSSARSELNVPTDLDVRSGKMVVTSAYTNILQWRNAATCAVTSTVNVPNVAGVVLGNDGKALVVSGNQILAYTEGSTTPTTVIGSGLTVPYRLSVNRNNGDIYVTELGTAGSTGHQVKRFNSAGVLQATYGKLGGRKLSGTWQPDSGFRKILDIAVVSTDSSFWICEGLYFDGARRSAHYDKNGRLIKEWFGGVPYAAQASADPDDPSIIWVDGDVATLYRIKMNWQTKSWTMLGTYTYSDYIPGDLGTSSKQFLQGSINEGQRWQVRKRNNKTYLARTVPPSIMYFDEAKDSLRLISMTTPAYAMNEVTAVTSAAGYPGQNTTRMFCWYDKNLDGLRTANEWSWSPDLPFGTWYNAWTQKTLGPDKDFKYYPFFPKGPDYWSWGKTWGAGIMTPTWTTVNGVDIPVYDYTTGLKYVTPQVEAIRNGTEAQRRAFNDSCIFPGRAHDYISPTNSAYSYAFGGVNADDSGNVFCSTRSGEKNDVFTNDHLIAKWDKNGAFEWAVGKRSTTAGVPAAGTIYRPDHLLGFTKGCVAMVDYLGDLNYVWDKDGLYVGNLVDKKHPNSSNLPESAWHTVGEQFGGEIFNVKTDGTPGLSKGDVLYFAPGNNSVPVYRITGWDSFISKTVNLTVSGGNVVAADPLKSSYVPAMRLAAAVFTVVNGSAPSITFSVSSASMVSVALYSAMGRKVAQLAQGRMEAGTHSVPVNQKLLSVGIYFVRGTINETVHTERIIVR